jgi:hypothetical protein
MAASGEHAAERRVHEKRQAEVEADRHHQQKQEERRRISCIDREQKKVDVDDRYANDAVGAPRARVL